MWPGGGLEFFSKEGVPVNAVVRYLNIAPCGDLEIT